MKKGRTSLLGFPFQLLAAPDKAKNPRVSAPSCMLPVIGTGKYNFRTLGIRRIRRLNMSRGGREGNNALTKDVSDVIADNNGLAYQLMEWNVPLKVVNEALALKLVQKYEVRNAFKVKFKMGMAFIFLLFPP